MKFQTLATALQTLEKTSSRNAMTEVLAELLREAEPDEAREVVYLSLGQLGPLYARVDFGVADKMVVRALARAFNLEAVEVLKRFKDRGDLGLVAEGIKAEIGAATVESKLSVKETYELLLAIATAAGAGSQEQKISLLADLVTQANAGETRYLVRMVLGKMRLGFSDKTILDALSVMANGSKSGRTSLEWAYQVKPDIGEIVRLVKIKGAAHVAEAVSPTIGVPVMPALAQRLKTADEMIKKMGKVVVEPKYDGTRVEIHFAKENGRMVKTFSRSLEETTAAFPEVLKGVEQIQAESVIIDAEAVGFNPETGAMLPFQETITRKRKHGVVEASQLVPLKFFCFDLMYCNGESWLNKPLYERRQKLNEVINEGEVLVVDPLLVTNSADEVRRFHAEQLAAGLEGAMVKKYDGEYQPGRTGWNWVKFKESEKSAAKLADTIDAIVLGYYRGKGKRSGFGAGAFLVGVRDKNENLVTVAKIGTGLSDQQWRELKNRVDSAFATKQPAGYEVAQALEPDVWAEPTIVVEIAADEITKSPLHSSGWGLRFPRLVRFRDDKTAAEATTLDEVLQIGGF